MKDARIEVERENGYVDSAAGRYSPSIRQRQLLHQSPANHLDTRIEAQCLLDDTVEVLELFDVQHREALTGRLQFSGEGVNLLAKLGLHLLVVTKEVECPCQRAGSCVVTLKWIQKLKSIQ